MLRLETSPKKAVRCVAYSPDGTLLASAGEDKLVKLWSLPGGELLGKFNGHAAAVSAVAFRKDGTAVASGDGANEIRVWSVPDGAKLNVLDNSRPNMLGSESIVGLEYGVNEYEYLNVTTWLPGRRGAFRGSRTFWYASPLFNCGRGQGTRDVYAAAIHPSGQELAISIGGTGRGASKTKAFVIRQGWPYSDDKGNATKYPLPSRALSLAFDWSGAQLAAAVERKVLVWTVEKSESSKLLKGHTAHVRGLAFTPDGRYLLSAGLDGLVIRWEVATGREVNRFDWQLGPLHAIAVAPDGLTAAVAGNGVAVFDLEG